MTGVQTCALPIYAATLQLKLRADLKTRLAAGLIYQVHGLNDAEKAAALRGHADARGFRLSQEVADYLLRHAERDMPSLLALLDEMFTTYRPEVASVYRQSLDLDALKFAWIGGLRKGEPHYYRIQGPTFVIEYDNTQNGANHIHTVWRDFDHEWGDDLLASHYQSRTHGDHSDHAHAGTRDHHGDHGDDGHDGHAHEDHGHAHGDGPGQHKH